MNRDADILVVIQCAARKNDNAGHFMSDDGRKILFVADPDHAPASDSTVYRRPDDFTSPGRTYRDELVAYNQTIERTIPSVFFPHGSCTGTRLTGVWWKHSVQTKCSSYPPVGA